MRVLTSPAPCPLLRFALMFNSHSETDGRRSYMWTVLHTHVPLHTCTDTAMIPVLLLQLPDTQTHTLTHRDTHTETHTEEVTAPHTVVSLWCSRSVAAP